jgi:hypothetical protein
LRSQASHRRRACRAARPAGPLDDHGLHVGDNNLEDFIVKDIELELGLAGSDADIKIVALADRGPGYDTSRGDWQTTKLYHVTQGIVADAASAVADWGERNFGDPQTLIDLVTWTKSQLPGRPLRALFLGPRLELAPGLGHGGRHRRRHARLPRDEGRDSAARVHRPSSVTTAATWRTMEIYKLWQNKATAIAASEEYVGWNGIEYDSVIAQLRANPFMSADQVAVASAQSAVVLGGERTFSAVAVDGRLANLLTATEQFAVALTNGLAANRKKYDRAFGATRSMWQAPMDKDFYDMANEIDIAVSDATSRRGRRRDECDLFSQALGRAHERLLRTSRHDDLPHQQGAQKDRITRTTVRPSTSRSRRAGTSS